MCGSLEWTDISIFIDAYSCWFAHVLMCIYTNECGTCMHSNRAWEYVYRNILEHACKHAWSPIRALPITNTWHYWRHTSCKKHGPANPWEVPCIFAPDKGLQWCNLRQEQFCAECLFRTQNVSSGTWVVTGYARWTITVSLSNVVCSKKMVIWKASVCSKALPRRAMLVLHDGTCWNIIFTTEWWLSCTPHAPSANHPIASPHVQSDRCFLLKRYLLFEEVDPILQKLIWPANNVFTLLWLMVLTAQLQRLFLCNITDLRRKLTRAPRQKSSPSLRAACTTPICITVLHRAQHPYASLCFIVLVYWHWHVHPRHVNSKSSEWLFISVQLPLIQNTCILFQTFTHLCVFYFRLSHTFAYSISDFQPSLRVFCSQEKCYDMRVSDMMNWMKSRISHLQKPHVAFSHPDRLCSWCWRRMWMAFCIYKMKCRQSFSHERTHLRNKAAYAHGSVKIKMLSIFFSCLLHSAWWYRQEVARQASLRTHISSTSSLPAHTHIKNVKPPCAHTYQALFCSAMTNISSCPATPCLDMYDFKHALWSMCHRFENHYSLCVVF
jgi:hypothetical protein